MTTRQFNKLTPAKRRMAIAADVIATLTKREHYSLGHTHYCHFYTDEPLLPSRDRQLRELLPMFEHDCEVCGIGAMLISHIRLADAVTVGRVNQDYGSYQFEADPNELVSLMDYFRPAELWTIESCYEGYATPKVANDPAIYRRWFEQYPDDERRLRAICRNILRNDGDFVATDVTGRRKKAA